MAKQHFIAPTIKAASLERMDPSQGFAIRCVLSNKTGDDRTVLGVLNFAPEDAAQLVRWLQTSRHRRAVERDLQLAGAGTAIAAWVTYEDLLFMLTHRYPCTPEMATLCAKIDAFLRGFATAQGVNTTKWVRQLSGRGLSCAVLLMAARFPG